MKLVELKLLKENTIYKKVIDELKLKGLDKLYIKKQEQIDYLDIILAVIEFLELNKKFLKRVNYENIVLIIINEIFEEMSIDISEDQLDKIIKLLKSSILIEKLSIYIWKQLGKLPKLFSCCSKKSLKIKEQDKEEIVTRL